jgi:glycosyltransferase involved in cell wall biosynthesis
MKKRVLHLISSLSGGGAERQLSFVASRLGCPWYESHVGYLQEGNDFPPDLLGGAVLHRIDAVSNYSPGIFRDICRMIAGVKPDVVHTWITQMDVLGGYASRIAGVPWILREPSAGPAYDRNWKHALRVAVARYASGIVANSKQGLQYWRERGLKVPLYVVRNGYDVDGMDAVAPVDVEEYGLDRGRKTVMFAGRLESTKNLDRLLDAFLIIQKETNAQLLLCGAGVLMPHIERRATEEGDKAIAVAGNVAPEVLWGLMKSTDAFCFVSEHEGMPNVVVEAGLCKVPLLVSDIPAHRELLDDTQCAFVDPYCVGSIARKLKEMIVDEKKAREKAIAARERMAEFTLAAMMIAYEEVYDSVMVKKAECAF